MGIPYQIVYGKESGGWGRENGVPGGTRTPNLLVRSQTLYPLSYGYTRTEIITEESARFNAHVVPGARCAAASHGGDFPEGMA